MVQADRGAANVSAGLSRMHQFNNVEEEQALVKLALNLLVMLWIFLFIFFLPHITSNNLPVNFRPAEVFHG